MVETEAFTSRPRTEWGSRVSPSIIGTNFINNVYEMIHPAGLTDDIANSGMAPALQIGRMDVPAEQETGLERLVLRRLRAQLREGSRLHPWPTLEGRPGRALLCRRVRV